MENKELFQISPNGYNCQQVEMYIDTLKNEYVKVVEIAKATDATNKKLKKICASLSEENKALKAENEASSNVNVDSDAMASIEKIISLCDEIIKENEVLRSINKTEA